MINNFLFNGKELSFKDLNDITRKGQKKLYDSITAIFYL